MHVVTCNGPSKAADISIRYKKELKQLEVWTKLEWGYVCAGTCHFHDDPEIVCQRIQDIAQDMFTLGYAVRAAETMAFLRSSVQK